MNDARPSVQTGARVGLMSNRKFVESRVNTGSYFSFPLSRPPSPLPLSMRWCRLIEKQMWLWYIHPYCIKIDWPTNFGSTGVPVAQRVCCAILKNQFSEIKQKQKCGQCSTHYVQCMCVAIPSLATRICSLFMFVQFSWVCFGSIPLCSVLFIFFPFHFFPKINIINGLTPKSIDMPRNWNEKQSIDCQSLARIFYSRNWCECGNAHKFLR